MAFMKTRKAVVRRSVRGRVYWVARLVAMRARLGLSQRGLARLIGVSVDTLQNWEQGRRQPSGPAVVLLTVLERDAEAVMRALR